MTKFIFSAIILASLSSVTYANEQHKLGFGLNYHLDQESSPGYQLNYQWQFGESFELESRYLNSNDINITKSNVTTFGHYSQFSIGANFIKQYNNDLSVKAGTGLGFITTSSNELLVEKQQIAPYLMLAANYQVTDRISIEMGQYSYFNNNVLDTNHSVYLNFMVNFGEGSSNYTVVKKTNRSKATSTATPIHAIKHNKKLVKAMRPSVVEQNNDVSAAKTSATARWFVQLGAYNNLANTEKSLKSFNKTLSKSTFSIKNYKGYYRIISQPFNTKQRADDYADMLKYQYSIAGYVTQLK